MLENNTIRHPRVEVADALRGFAVLAIVLLHSIEHFNFYSFPDAATRPQWLNFGDKAIWDSLFFLFGGKAYAIFALLFGFSFFIQDYNCRMRGTDFRGRFCWRLAVLFAIGCFNAAFFTGEILVLYSIVGFVLVLTCRLGTRTLAWLAAFFLLQPVCLWQIARAVLSADYHIPHIESAPLWAETFRVQSSAGFLETVKVNLVEGQLASLAWAWEHGRMFQTAALFIFGMLAGRLSLFSEEKLPVWGKILATALAAYFPLKGLDAMFPAYVERPDILTPLHILLSSLASFCFMLILVSGILFAYYKTAKLRAALEFLIPYGRMSMTNYVTQGIIGASIFYHWGAYVQAGTTESLLVGVAIFMVQYVFCRYWVERHAHGPFEYAWKRATWIGS